MNWVVYVVFNNEILPLAMFKDGHEAIAWSKKYDCTHVLNINDFTALVAREEKEHEEN